VTAPTLDRITSKLVDAFVAATQIEGLSDAERFERFVNFSVISSEHSDTFDIEDVSGPGNEVGIDGIAVIVNGALVTTPEQVTDLASRNGYVEATFVFVSSKRSASFAEAEVANLAMAVSDFFGDATLPRTDFIDGYLEVKQEVYASGALFSRGLPVLKLYYVTMGRWEEPPVIVHRIDHERAQLEATEQFEHVQIQALGAKQLRELYFRTQKPVEREFSLKQRVTLPPIPGVSEAYLGIIPATDYVELLEDDAGQLRKSLFTDNVRDFRGAANPVNASIASTLRSPERDRFAILNNGVTVVARDIRVTGDRLFMRGYQVVNGGQTSHVLFEEKASLDENVWVPIRIIGTDDDDLTTAVVTATNSQTPVAAQELHSRSQFERDLERYFATFTGPQALHYERRTRQYSDATDIEKVRIITRDQLVRAFAAMFLDEPHRATGYVPTLMDQLGQRIMREDHKLEPYYAAAYGQYRLEFLLRNKQLQPMYKPGRWQVLMAARHLGIGPDVGAPTSKEITNSATELMEIFWDDKRSLALFKDAITAVDAATNGSWRRDYMRNQPTTQAVLKHLSSP
jgi:AIPR protein